MKKLFVVDTNVVLFDHTCIYNFKEHDVALSIVVLEELDRFKRGNDLINLEARQFIRELDELAGDGPLTEGLPLGEERGRLFVEIGEATPGRVSQAFALGKPDHRILALAEELRERRKDRQVILVSKDVNLRMKAKSLGLLAEDYTTGKVRNVERLYSGTACWEGLSGEAIARLHHEPHSVPLAEFQDRGALLPNQYLVMRNGSLSALAHHNRQAGTLERVSKRMAYGVEPRNAEQIFALDALMRPEVQLLTLTGRAGTGKTLLALAAALEQRRLYHQIYLARPVVPLGNRDIGFLPGDVKSKLDPYMQPLWDNISVIRHRLSPESKEHEGPLGDDRAREDPDRAARLHPGPLARPRLLHRGRGAEPHAARGEDDHHAGRRGLEGGLHRRHPPDRHALPRQPVERPHRPHRPDEGAGAVRPREPGEGRAQPPRGAREHAAVGRPAAPRAAYRRLQSIRMPARARNGGPSVLTGVRPTE